MAVTGNWHLVPPEESHRESQTVKTKAKKAIITITSIAVRNTEMLESCQVTRAAQAPYRHVRAGYHKACNCRRSPETIFLSCSSCSFLVRSLWLRWRRTPTTDRARFQSAVLSVSIARYQSHHDLRVLSRQQEFPRRDAPSMARQQAVGDSHMARAVRTAPFLDFARRYPIRPPRINKERAFFC